MTLRFAMLAGAAMLSAGLAPAPLLAQPAASSTAVAALAPRDPARGVLSFHDAVARSLPAVVRIIIIGRNAETGEDGVIGSGSGVIIDAARGEILTNNHVVEQASRLQALTSDGRTLDLRVIGRDPATDIALVTTATRGLAAAPLGDSSALAVGDVAFAVGYPLGLEQTLTMGIVSGLGRSGIGEGLEDFIQTDAAINSGNSGGALLDSEGRLVGINTAILSRSGGNIGIGFAVPVRVALAIADQLRQFGEVRHGRIGISVSELTTERAAALHLASTRGALVSAITPGSPAARAGLREGDVIISADGRPVASTGNLTLAVGLVRPGGQVRLGFVRGGTEQSATITVGEPEPTLAAAAGPGPEGGAALLLGASLRDLRSGDPFPQGAYGALVAAVPPGSPAAARGLAAGDLVVALNGEPVRSAADLLRRLGAARGRAQLVIARGNSLIPLTIG